LCDVGRDTVTECFKLEVLFTFISQHSQFLQTGAADDSVSAVNNILYVGEYSADNTESSADIFECYTIHTNNTRQQHYYTPVITLSKV